jgi:hypothetical protein
MTSDADLVFGQVVSGRNMDIASVEILELVSRYGYIFNISSSGIYPGVWI